MKAQVSTEFIAAIFLSIVIFSLFSAYGFFAQKNNADAEKEIEAKEILQKVANSINFASRIEGFEARPYITQRLELGDYYNLSVSKTAAVIKWGDNAYIISLQTANVTNASNAISFVISPGNRLIKNIGDGAVRIE